MSEEGIRPVRLERIERGSGNDHDWPEPRPLAARSEPPTFPLEEAYPDGCCEIRGYVEALAEATQTPIDLPAVHMLPIIAAAIAQRRELTIRPGWVEPPALWTMGLMESANRKSPVNSRLIEPFTSWERDEKVRVGPEIARRTATRNVLERRLKDAETKAGKSNSPEDLEETQRLAAELDEFTVGVVPRLLTTEPTSEALAALLAANQERALLASAESGAFDVLLGRYTGGRANYDVYLKAWSGEPIRIDRATRGPVHLEHPLLSIALCVQPASVEELFESRQARGRGMLARFLVTAPKSRIGSRKIEPDPEPDELHEAYRSAIRGLLEIPIPQDGPQSVTLGPEAAGVFRELREETERRLAPGGDLSGMLAWAGKLPGQIARLALCLHCLEDVCQGNDEPVIRAATMRCAVAWAPYFIESMRHVEGLVLADPAVRRAQKIIAWIQRHGRRTFSRRDAYRGVQSTDVNRAELVDEPLEILVEHGFIRPRPQPKREGRGQPPSPQYEGNPRLTERTE